MRSLDDWLDYISSQHWQSIDMGLERMSAMVDRMELGQPAASIITVAGTNGKGSTCIACEHLLLQQGLSVGVTLSPHVTRFNERIRIDGQEADDASICEAFAAVDAARGKADSEQYIALTYFEFSALAALWCFKQRAVDVAILEIGLGGRLDAFNVIDADVAVITSIGMDHETFLGNTLADIGIEKAGILRRGQQVALGAHLPESIMERCAQLSLSPTVVGEQWSFETNSVDDWSITYQGRTVLDNIPYGACAPHNLLLAYLAVSLTTHLDASCNGFHDAPNVTDIIEVAADMHMPGRMQQQRLDEREYILDVAHNPQGATFLVEQLSARGIVPAAIVCGMLRDKHHQAVVDIVAGAFDAPWIFVDTQGERGMPAAGLRAAAGSAIKQKQSSSETLAVASWAQVRREVISATEPGDVILAFGSFSLIEQYLRSSSRRL